MSLDAFTSFYPTFQDPGTYPISGQTTCQVVWGLDTVLTERTSCCTAAQVADGASETFLKHHGPPCRHEDLRVTITLPRVHGEIETLCLQLDKVLDSLDSDSTVEQREEAVRTAFAQALNPIAEGFKRNYPDRAAKPLKVWFETNKVLTRFGPLLPPNFIGRSIERKELNESFYGVMIVGAGLIGALQYM